MEPQKIQNILGIPEENAHTHAHTHTHTAGSFITLTSKYTTKF
jgi:hypothetical protein